jgi:hypothetical protein
MKGTQNMGAHTYELENGVRVVTSRYTYDVLGQYVGDEAVCIECEPEVPEIPAEDGEGYPIFADQELDAPEHCVRCGALIDCRLTGDGERYVREAFDAGRTPITRAWRAVFDYAWPRSDYEPYSI